MQRQASMDKYSKRKQDGGILIMAAIVMSSAVILLASIDIGFLFYQKRELQKVADLAALAGAQQLVKAHAAGETSCNSAFVIAQANANTNVFPDTISVSCGRWDPKQTSVAPHYSIFVNGNWTTQPANAIEVRLNRSFPSFFGNWTAQRVDAQAIAMGTPLSPVAVFSVGSRLFQIREDGAVPTLLSAIGLDLGGTGLASYEGLANVPVQTAGLLKELGFNIDAQADVATIKSILNTSNSNCTTGSCPLGVLLAAIETVGGQQELLSLLGGAAADLNLQIKLLTDATGRGLFTLLDVANGQAALLTNINAMDLLSTALGIANSERFKDLSTNLNVPAVASVTTKVGVVEAPSIGIGGIGTTAYTAQVRLFSRIQANKLTAGLLSVDLPIVVDLVNGHGTITDMCNVKDVNGKDTATIAVQAPILGACVGNITEANAFSRADTCGAGLQNKEVVNLLSNALQLNTSFRIEALQSNFSPVTLSKGQSVTLSTNNLQIGATLQAILGTVLGKLLDQGQGAVTNSSLATRLLAATSNSLDASIDLLKTSVNSLSSFVSGLNADVRALLNGSLTSAVVSVLNSVGGLVNNLLGGLGKFLGVVLTCGVLPTDQCKLAYDLQGTQTSGGNTISNVMLSLLGLVTELLRPIFDNLGSQLANALNNLLGLQIGEVDIKLIDLNCATRTDVRLVH